MDLMPCYQQLGFHEPPFSLTPDTAFFFKGSRYLSALDHLRFGIASGAMTVLTGEVGLGKTLLCRYLLRHPPQGVRFAYLLNPDQSYGDLLVSIHQDLTGQMPKGRTIGSLQRELTRLLLDLGKRGKRVVVLVDEAHRLPAKVLEGLRLLSNVDTEKEKLLSFVFVGQPELERTLATPSLRPLAQRVSVRYRLHPMAFQETMAYIPHRLRIAEGDTRIQFGMMVKSCIYYLSAGVPRRINQLCDRVLLAAYAYQKTEVRPWMVWRAKQEMAGVSSKRGFSV